MAQIFIQFEIVALLSNSFALSLCISAYDVAVFHAKQIKVVHEQVIAIETSVFVRVNRPN